MGKFQSDTENHKYNRYNGRGLGIASYLAPFDEGRRGDPATVISKIRNKG